MHGMEQGGLERLVQEPDTSRLAGLVFTFGVASAMSGAYWLGKDGVNKGERVLMSLGGPLIAMLANQDLNLLYANHASAEQNMLTLATLYGITLLSYALGRAKRYWEEKKSGSVNA